MMLNIIDPKDDRTARTQLRLQDLARDLSGPTRRRAASARARASAAGSAGLNQLGAGPYRLVGTDTLDEALRLAAASIRQTNRPVGLLVWRGRHAWVMSGFQATADPRATTDYTVTAAIVMDPLYPYGSTVWGRSPKPREALTPTDARRQFVPRRQGSILAGGRSAPARGDDGRRCPASTSSSCPYETIPTSATLPASRADRRVTP